MSNPYEFQISKSKYLEQLKEQLEGYLSISELTKTDLSLIQKKIIQGINLFQDNIDHFVQSNPSQLSKPDSSSNLDSFQGFIFFDYQKKALLVFELIKLLLMIPSSLIHDNREFLNYRNYFVKSIVCDIEKEERNSVFELIEYERHNKVDPLIIQLYNELGYFNLLKTLSEEGRVDSLKKCIYSLSLYWGNELKLPLDFLVEIKMLLIEWLLNGEREVKVIKDGSESLIKSIFRKSIKATINELDGEKINGFYTILNKGETLNTTHLNNINSFSIIKPWLANFEGREDLIAGLNFAVTTYIFRVFDQTMKNYDSLDPIPEMSSEKWINYIEGTIEECLSIFIFLIRSNNSLLIERSDSLQKLWKRVIKKQKGFSYLCFLKLCLEFKELILFELESLFTDFFENHLLNQTDNTLLCIKSLDFLQKNSVQIHKNTQAFEKFFKVPLKIFCCNPSLYDYHICKLLTDITNRNSFLHIFSYLIDLPIITRIYNLEEVMNLDNPTANPLDWIDYKYYSLFNYLKMDVHTNSILTEHQVDLLFSLYKITCPTIREKRLCQILENIIIYFLKVVESEEYEKELPFLILLIIKRYQYLFLPIDLEKSLKNHFKSFIEKILRKYPTFLQILCKDLNSYILDLKNATRDLVSVMHLIWLISEIIPSSVNSFEENSITETWKKYYSKEIAKAYCENMELILHELIFALMNNIPKIEKALDNSSFISLLLSSLTKLSIKYPDLKHNVLLIQVRLLEKHQDLSSLIKSKLKLNLKLLNDSSVSFLMFELK